jgi:mono/diheme cytochrome c family protein
MRRLSAIAALLAVLATVVVAAGCGPGEPATATPETVIGDLPKPGGQVDIPALALDGDAAAGKTVFASAGCAGCHVLSDAGATGTVGPNLDSSKPGRDLIVQRVALGQGGMPPFSKAEGGQLEDQQIADVAAYIVQATGG